MGAVLFGLIEVKYGANRFGSHSDRDAKVRKWVFFGYDKEFSIFTLNNLAYVNSR